jgi:hypothetical protein
MLIVDDATNNFYAPTLITVPVEYKSILSKILQDILKKPSQNRMLKIGCHNTKCNIELVHCNQLVCMLIMEEGINNYEASTLITLSSEYIIIL